MNNLDLKRGQGIKVFQKVVDGKRERVVAFQGKILKSRGAGENKMLTVRQYVDGVDVDRIFPVNAPSIVKLEKLDEKLLKKSLK